MELEIYIRHVVELLLNPLFLCLLLFVIFLIFLYLNHDKKNWGRVGLFSVFVLLLVFSTGWLAKYLTHYLENQYPVAIKIDPQIRWIVVFSGGQSEESNLPPNILLKSVSIDRLVEGIRLYRQLQHAKLLISGGGYNFQIPEAIRLAQVVAWFKIPREDIVIESTSVNTKAEALAIKTIVKKAPFYLVTSAVHMPRSIKLCREQGLTPKAAPTDFTFYWGEGGWERTYLPNPYNLYYLSIAMHEILGDVATRGRALLKNLGVHNE